MEKKTKPDTLEELLKSDKLKLLNPMSVDFFTMKNTIK